MGSALIVGDRGSGLTTFLGLLYTAQVRLGTELADQFRFSAERETIRQLEAIYGELADGRFPERDVDWEEHPLSFTLGFKWGGFSAFGAGAGDGFATVRVSVGGISTEDLAELREHDAVLGATTRRLLRSQVVIPLVDASRLPRSPDEAPSPALARYDQQLAATLGLLGKFLGAERRRRDRKMHLLFVLTKMDRCPRSVLTSWGAPPVGPVVTWTAEERARIGALLLERYLPSTNQWIVGGAGRAPHDREPVRWFFSELALRDPPGTSPIVRRSRLPVGGWEPEYPFEEYRALVERLGWLGQHLASDAMS